MQKLNSMFQRAKGVKIQLILLNTRKSEMKYTRMLQTAKQSSFSTLTSANSEQFWKMVKLVNKQQESIPTLGTILNLH